MSFSAAEQEKCGCHPRYLGTKYSIKVSFYSAAWILEAF